MSYPGEYIDPLPRVSNVFCAMTSGGTDGYACARLRRTDPLFYSGSGDDDEAQVYLQNLGTTNFTVQLRQTQDYSPAGTDSDGTPTGTRFDLGSAVALVPGGRSTVQVSPYMKFVEFYCTSGLGNLKAQITGRVRWERMAFDKLDPLDDDTLWNVKPIPAASTSVP